MLGALLAGGATAGWATAGCATAGATPSEAPRVGGPADRPAIDPAALAVRIHERVNAERASRGLPPLAWDNRLAALATAFSEQMARRGFFAHVGPDGRDPTARGEAAGLRCRRRIGDRVRIGVAENLFSGHRYSWRRVTIEPASGHRREQFGWNTPAALAEQAVQGWLASPGHRRNLLDPELVREGLGVAVDQDGKVLVTQDFC